MLSDDSLQQISFGGISMIAIRQIKNLSQAPFSREYNFAAVPERLSACKARLYGAYTMHTHKENTMKKQKGFSLIELMIVVAIIGIIAVIAVPSYQSYVVKGNRAAAQAFMVDVTNREKQYLLDARAYTNSFVTLGISAPADVSRHYANIAIACTDGVSAATGCTVVANSPPTFTITATPTSTQQTGDGWLSLTNDGTKGSQFSGKW